MFVLLSRGGAARTVCLAAALGLPLAGCVEDNAALSVAAPTQGAHMAARAGVSPRGAPIAFVSLVGAPDGVVARFSQATLSAAAKRDVEATGAESAAYLARGYMTATPGEDGVAFEVVWDLYDKGRHRAQRLDNQVVVKGQAGDPWALADERVMAALAGQSADDLAATLSNTPEAVAAAAAPSAVVAMDPGAARPSATASSYR